MAKRDIDKQIEQIRATSCFKQEAIVCPQPTPAKKEIAYIFHAHMRCVIFSVPSNRYIR